MVHGKIIIAALSHVGTMGAGGIQELLGGVSISRYLLRGDGAAACQSFRGGSRAWDLSSSVHAAHCMEVCYPHWFMIACSRKNRLEDNEPEANIRIWLTIWENRMPGSSEGWQAGPDKQTCIVVSGSLR